MKNRYSSLALLFSVFHCLFFIILFAFARKIPGVDVGENFFWGKEWQWGYYKHPPLFAWLQEIFGYIFGINVIASYITGQTCIFIALIAVFLLAREYVGERKALFCVLLLEGLSFTGISSRTFNADVLQIPLWALSALFYLYAIQTGKYLYFILLGIFLGLAFLGKYFAVLLGLTLFISMVSCKETRHFLKTPLPYISAICFLIVISPHIIWLFYNNFLPLKYIFLKQNGQTCKFCRFASSQSFIGLSAGSILGLCGGLLFMFKKIKFNGYSLDRAKNNLLFYITLLPFIIICLLIFIFGIFIRNRWSAPLFFYLPIFFLYFWQFEEKPLIIKKGVVFLTTCFILWSITTLIGGYNNFKRRGQYYNTITKIAMEETVNWNREFKSPIKIVAGDTFAAGIFAMFSSDRPSVFACGKEEFNSYIATDYLSKEGVLLLEGPSECDLYGDYKILKERKSKIVREEIIYVKKKPARLIVKYIFPA